MTSTSKNWLVQSSLVAALGLLSASCGNSGGGGTGSMYIEQCSLGCTNGLGGTQVSCGIINTFQNQELSILFSEDVDFSTVDDKTIQIVDTQTAAFPDVQFVADPTNPRRVIIRPSLAFDPSGNSIFGLEANHSYQIRVAGRAQGDPAPWVQSVSGQTNSSRLLCTITTDQGVTDPVPGKPSVDVLVDTLTANNVNVPVSSVTTTDVKTNSTITLVFNDLMDIGTLVVGGSSPLITVMVDPDGNFTDPSDQAALAGTWDYDLDLATLTTTVTFTPSIGLPSKGSDPLQPRRVIVTIPNSVRDLAGNSLSDFGLYILTPQAVSYTAQTLPGPNGEQFTSQANRDGLRTGADWGVTTSGRLKPGVGGGSGRLGDFKVLAGQTVTLVTSATKARGTLTVSATPIDGDQIQIGASVLGPFQFVTGVQTGTPLLTPPGTAIQNHFQNKLYSYSLLELVNFLNASADPDVAQCTYSLVDGNQILIEAKTAGSAGNAITFSVTPATATNVWTASGSTLTGGQDFETFAAGNLVDNFDYDANPGGSPIDIDVDDGVFEFASLTVQSGGTLRFVGDNPARVLVRGDASIQGTIDISGATLGSHPSDSGHGQLGGIGGPGGGNGGNGGDRYNQTGTLLATNDLPAGGTIVDSINIQNSAVKNPGASVVGTPGEGVGGTGLLAAGPGGVQWPTNFPGSIALLNDFATNSVCDSEQVGAPGGGGGYAVDGGPGVPIALNGLSIQGSSNVPADTAGGNSSVLGIEPPGSTPLKVRKLTPKKGYLRGGAGGGGAGLGLSQTHTTGGGANCISVGAKISTYRDHSGAGGGGGGGALQLQAGDSLQLDGVINAAGGGGGSAVPSGAQINRINAAPGGGGAGGAVLLQATTLSFGTLSGARIDADGAAGGIDNTGSTGGTGSVGLVRLEGKNTLDMNQIAPFLNPFDALDPTSALFASSGTWVIERTYPDSFSGAQSCWFRPLGVTYFEIDFPTDSGSTYAWNMDLILNIGGTVQTVPYRGPNSILPGGQSYEELWGTYLNPDVPVGGSPAPLVVRFQGVRTSKPISDMCGVDVTDPASGVVSSTLTPWVTQPHQLNDFQPQPDMIRFAILFDASHSDFIKILGVTNFRITGIPD
ncbi:MAG: hypothetical protein IT453_05075 [Planctomycetes bacterium]|nr:hypothetical protein [Planctomycetota bacterium]